MKRLELLTGDAPGHSSAALATFRIDAVKGLLEEYGHVHTIIKRPADDRFVPVVILSAADVTGFPNVVKVYELNGMTVVKA